MFMQQNIMGTGIPGGPRGLIFVKPNPDCVSLCLVASIYVSFLLGGLVFVIFFST